MNNEKEIEQIVKHACNREGIAKRCPQRIAEALVEAGYGDVKQAVKEFAENEIKPLIDEIVELMFDNSRSVCQIEKCFKSDDISCGASVCVEENKLLWKSKVDARIKKLYGEEEGNDG